MRSEQASWRQRWGPTQFLCNQAPLHFHGTHGPKSISKYGNRQYGYWNCSISCAAENSCQCCHNMKIIEELSMKIICKNIKVSLNELSANCAPITITDHQYRIYLNLAGRKVTTPAGDGDKSHTAAEEITAVTPDCWSLKQPGPRREERRGPSQELMWSGAIMGRQKTITHYHYYADASWKEPSQNLLRPHTCAM